MKISRDWLTDSIDLSGLSDGELGKRMTEIGHAVEATETHGADTVFEVEFTSNRIDAMSHLGLARELGAALGREVRIPPGDSTPPAEPREVSIRIDAPELCSRFTGLVIRGVTVKPSSAKIQRRLEAVGLRPINNIVDATNYVMLALGHPLHAYDLRDLEGNRIIVRAGAPGETLTTLDGVARTLDPATAVIADGKRGVGIGGIMGGENSEIADDTRDVLLECAHFDPPSIRRAARRMGLKTDASYRFERSIDPNDTIRTITACAELILEEAGGERGELVDVVARPIGERTIVLREARLSEISDGRIGLGWALGLFRSLGFGARTVEGGIELKVPTWRGDIAEEADLAEEALRFYGYDNIPSSLPRVTSGDIFHSPMATLEDEVRSLLVGAGLSEAITYGFVQPEQNALFSKEDPLTVTNALTELISSMRLSLAPGLLATVAYNRSYGTRDGALFEIGRTYHRAGGGATEIPRAGFVLFGQTGLQWGEGRRAWDFFDLKGIVEAIAEHLHVELAFEPVERPWLRAGSAAAASADGREVAVAGAIAREVLERFDLKGDVLLAEVDLAGLSAARGEWTMEAVSRFPGIPMVLALMHAPDLRYETLVEQIRGLELPYLRTVGLWDRFVPPGGDEVKTALGMWYQATDRSLTQEEVAEMHATIARRIEGMLPVRIVGSA
jgi:phenylalanyl-tRNA synthetase beta chain